MVGICRNLQVLVFRRGGLAGMRGVFFKWLLRWQCALVLFEDMARATLKSDFFAYNAVPRSEVFPLVEMGRLVQVTFSSSSVNPYQPCMAYFPSSRVEFYGFHVGKYTVPPMDAMGNKEGSNSRSVKEAPF